jgi:hypothetical protein
MKNERQKTNFSAGKMKGENNEKAKKEAEMQMDKRSSFELSQVESELSRIFSSVKYFLIERRRKPKGFQLHFLDCAVSRF